MLEKVLSGTRWYWGLVVLFSALIAVGLSVYLEQFREGLTITGLGREVPWGLYIAQFTFLVGVAASAVVLVLPYYLHDYKAFSKLVVLGEFLAVAAVIMCMLFIFVDMGQPRRVMNVILHPTLSSLMFWDMLVLSGYLILNVVISWVTFGAEVRGVPPAKWIKPVILLSIPWAISIHTVTAFLYSGLGGRPFWFTAILAPRFLASAFASGPAILILLSLLLRRFTRFDVGEKAIRMLGTIVTYALAINIFFVAVELFTVVYSNIPGHLAPFQYLFFGLGEGKTLVPWMWTSQLLGIVALVFLLIPKIRHQHRSLVFLCIGVILSIWIDKGLGMICGGFVPSTLGEVKEYWPTLPEVLIGLGVYGVGAFILTVLYKMVVAERELVLAVDNTSLDPAGG
ncbi:MAG: sulfate reduction electron transfer complex DsrMKJOP subunit DsrP [Planctomycetota bacterium]|jgi:molybdopterin-containing oxidoreductase family membrane subunit